MKKFIGMLAGAFCLALAVLLLNPVEAKAAGRYVRVTYDVDTDAWYENIDNTYWVAIGDTVTNIEDGDTVLVDAADKNPTKRVNIVTDKRIGTLAVCGNTVLSITCPTPADLVYAANGATLIYTGNVKKVVCNPKCPTQIIGNAEEVEAIYENGKNPIFAVTGTVGKFTGKVTDGKIFTDLAYDFPAGTVHSYDDGIVYVEEGTLKGAPSGNSGSTGNAGSNGKELDKVPKTGSGVNMSLIFFGISALLAITAVTLKRRESVKQ